MLSSSSLATELSIALAAVSVLVFALLFFEFALVRPTSVIAT